MNFNRGVLFTGIELIKFQNMRQPFHSLDSTVITDGDSEVLNWLYEMKAF